MQQPMHSYVCRIFRSESSFVLPDLRFAIICEPEFVRNAFIV